jgi:hypothetical protein
MYATTHRRLLAALLALMLLAFCGCGKKEGTPSNSGQTASNWKKVLADYEDWADSYLALAEKYAKDPTNASLLSEYTEMAEEALDWAKEIESLEGELSAQEAAEFAKEAARIAAKLAKAGL